MVSHQRHTSVRRRLLRCCKTSGFAGSRSTREGTRLFSETGSVVQAAMNRRPALRMQAAMNR